MVVKDSPEKKEVLIISFSILEKPFSQDGIKHTIIPANIFRQNKVEDEDSCFVRLDTDFYLDLLLDANNSNLDKEEIWFSFQIFDRFSKYVENTVEVTPNNGLLFYFNEKEEVEQTIKEYDGI